MRTQAQSDIWHRLRENRLTSSNFKKVCSRQSNFENLALQLNRKNKQSAAMKYGIEMEPVAAKVYANTFGRNTYKVGFIINPSVSYLGCSPERRVYDPDAEDKYGLLEIKCTTFDSVSECTYLKLSNGILTLKKSHGYFNQVMGQLAFTGAPWCDFFCSCKK